MPEENKKKDSSLNDEQQKKGDKTENQSAEDAGVKKGEQVEQTEISPEISVEELFKLSVRVGERRQTLAGEIEKLEDKKSELDSRLKDLTSDIRPKSRLKKKIKSVTLESPALPPKDKMERKLAISALKKELFNIREALKKVHKEYKSVVGSEIKANNIQKYRSQAQSQTYNSRSYRFLQSDILKALNRLIEVDLEGLRQLKELAGKTYAKEEKDEFYSKLLSLFSSVKADRAYVFCSVGISREALIPSIKETLKKWNPDTEKEFKKLVEGIN